MKRLIAALFVGLSLFLIVNAFAAPHVYSDSYTSPAVIPDSFKVILDGGAEVSISPWSGTLPDNSTRTNALRFDVGTVTVGSHAISVKACKNATIWDPEVCSASTPFSFSRPAPPVPPGEPSGFTLSR